MTTIRFHVGAHKTASTHLQMMLSRCSFETGTRHVPLKRLRHTLITPVRKSRPRLPWHRWYKGTWLFSDENVLGTSANGLLIYPEPAKALRYFLDCRLSVFLCIRAYDTFLTSAWGERLWHHPFQPFVARPPQRRWADLVRDLQQALPGTPIHVWQYEDYREHARQIAQFFAGGAITDFGPPVETSPKSGFSGQAVQALSDCQGKRAGKSRILRAREQFPVSDRYPRFDPWSDALKAELSEMYTEDLRVIADIADLWQSEPQSPKR